jgi:hypothetical protein
VGVTRFTAVPVLKLLTDGCALGVLLATLYWIPTATSKASVFKLRSAQRPTVTPTRWSRRVKPNIPSSHPSNPPRADRADTVSQNRHQRTNEEDTSLVVAAVDVAIPCRWAGAVEAGTSPVEAPRGVGTEGEVVLSAWVVLSV